MPHRRKATGRDRDSRVFFFLLSCHLCGAQEHSYGNFTQHMLERRCSGYPVHCEHCGTIFFSGFDFSQHLNVRGLTRSVPPPAYGPTTVTPYNFVSLNSVSPAAVSSCPSTIFSVSSASPAPSILHFSLDPTSNSPSLNSNTEHTAISTCHILVTLSVTSSPQNFSSASLTSCLSPSFLFTGHSPNFPF